ncbi:unnamed protein product [Caenorhabditis auriculariae]|uniref:CUB domain-containing protein n=1 Tax=Caenorhabditis auriculariae TaxID=2777116 RepID=A0A8S1GP65_9PELO|nr:unnamed protein product [Caenorhabditis auriculariae]
MKAFQIWLQLMTMILTQLVMLIPAEPLSSFFDGLDSRNECKARLDRRITGFSGILYSHSKYGKEAYNASRNCVLMLVAPIGYRVRVRALLFDVPTNTSATCEKDTLHVFDHETMVDPESFAPPRIDDITSPGPIIGQFCGHLPNRVLNASTNNAMTLWWHANAENAGNPSKGFKLHWNAFRAAKTGTCQPDKEFSCGNDECIPLELACDKYPDCANGADLVHSRQLEANCLNVSLDPLTSVSGLVVLLLSAIVILSCCCGIAAVCYCCKKIQSNTPFKGSSQQSSTNCVDYKPEPPQFYPPSPPKMPPPSAASDYTPRKQIHFDPSIPTQNENNYRIVRLPAQFGETDDYTYVRNDVHRNLL